MIFLSKEEARGLSVIFPLHKNSSGGTSNKPNIFPFFNKTGVYLNAFFYIKANAFRNMDIKIVNCITVENNI